MPLPTPPSELLRALAVLSEPPRPSHRRIAAALGLGPPPPEAAYTDLFVFQLYPYASVYLGPEGMLGGEARDRIAGFWRALGETPPAEPDHLAVLLALYARLGELEEAAPGLLAARRWRHARRVLLWEYLLSWLPAYLEAMVAVAPAFYRRWAGMLLRYLRAEARRRKPPGPRRVATARWAPAWSAARQESPDRPNTEAEDLVARVLAPGRGGMILLRDDLRRAARDLGLGLRLGERRFVLQQMLGQDPSAMAGWLRREALHWARVHRRHRCWLGPSALSWQARVEGTARCSQRVLVH